MKLQLKYLWFSQLYLYSPCLEETMNDHLVVPVETISSREAARTSMTKAQTDTTDESYFASLFEVPGFPLA